MYEIEVGIPAPINYGKAGTPNKYPFGLLEVGQSFFVEGKTARALSNAAQWYKRDGKKFVTKTMDGGARCWRTA